MRPVPTVQQVREAERAVAASLPGGGLMARAVAPLAARCTALLRAARGRVPGSRVVLLVGSGDNGGDALLVGARLAARGARVDALATDERVHPAGLSALRAHGGRVRRVDEPAGAEDLMVLLRTADLVVDGLLGIGGRGGLREPAASVARLLRRVRTDGDGPLVLAVDLPSGVDADTGAVAGEAVDADVTVSPGAWKAGLLVTPGSTRAGVVEVVDIGLGPHLGPTATSVLDLADVAAALLPRPGARSSKYARGVLGVCAGSGTYTGAAVLCVGGAVRGGAGMVRAVSTSLPADAVRRTWPEAVVTAVEHGDADGVLGAGRVQAWAVGPGLGTDDDAARVVRALLATDLPVLVDADGLTVLAQHPGWLRDRDAPTLLTPHVGEFARLVGREPGSTEADRLGAARAAAADLGVHVLLKGSATVVAAPDGQAFVNPTGTGWLATAGSGDVLSGLCGALLATGLDPLRAGAVGAFVHGVAGGLAARGRAGPDGPRPDGGGEAPITGEDLVAAVADAWRACTAPAAGAAATSGRGGRPRAGVRGWPA